MIYIEAPDIYVYGTHFTFTFLHISWYLPTIFTKYLRYTNLEFISKLICIEYFPYSKSIWYIFLLNTVIYVVVVIVEDTRRLRYYRLASLMMGVCVFNIKRRWSRVIRRHKNAKDVVTEREYIRYHITVGRESTNNI